MLVLLPNAHLQYIITHAKNTYPEECCGFLIGINSTPRMVRRVQAAQNVAQPSRLKRYSIDPPELVRADEEARRSNLDLVGVYHSHPDSPVTPSRIDLEYAWPDFAYLVLSLRRAEPRDVGVWSLNQDGTAFELDELRVV